MFRTALLILSGNAASSLLTLARNLLVARLIPVEDYGIAATFAMAMAVIEMMSNLGLQQQIVQAKDGDDPRLQAALQGFQLLRGLLSGAVLFVSAGVLAEFMNIEEVAWAYRVMALVPVLNALQHFDIHRLSRRMVFLPMILTSTVPALLSLLLAWPLAHWLGDYRVMLYALLLQATGMAAVSHLAAERPWRAVMDRAVMARALRFGWPLMINNLLLFAVFNGERIIVGRELGMAALGIFSMGMTLTLTPTLVLAKSTQNFFLPQLSRAHAAEASGRERFIELAHATMQAPLLAGAVLAVGAFLVGGPLVHLLLGDKYLPLLPYLVWLAVMQGLRVAKAGPGIVALAAGHTSNAMVANLLRVLALPVAWYVAVTSGDLLVIVWVACAAELAGYVVALAMLRFRIGLWLGGLVWVHVSLGGLLGVVGWLSLGRPPQGLADPAPWPAWGFLSLGLLVCIATMRELWRYVRAGQVRQGGLK